LGDFRTRLWQASGFVTGFDDDDGKGGSTKVATRADLAAALEASARQRPYLIIVKGRTSVGTMIELSAEMVIGRTASAELFLDEDGVSRRHARIHVRDDGTPVLDDLGSTNGTFVNGERIKSRALQDGDKIQIGTISILKFSYQDALDEALQKNLYESATRDGLTRVYNRKYLSEALPREVGFATRHGRPLSLMMIDIDHFKKINDTHGHSGGDFVLQSVARTLGVALRDEDTLARYGGEEFAAILRDTGAADALLCAERLRRGVEGMTYDFAGAKVAVTVSVGVATMLPDKPITHDKLVETADRCLYQAKRNGRNRVESVLATP